MPNRVLRDWTDSEIVDKLSAKAEVFFTRLIMKADDFGFYYANTKLLKANLYPLRDNMRPNEITPLLQECVSADLLITYTVAGKEYLQIKNFGQRLRQSKRRFPEPTENGSKKHDSELLTNDSELRLETETETETETEGQKLPNHTQDEINSFKNFQEWIKKNTPRVNQLKEPITIDQFFKLKQKLSKETVQKLLTAMQNYKPLLTKSISAYLTILNWSKREKNEDEVINSNNQKLSINEALKQTTKEQQAISY